jgi:hypothetical protein
MRVRLNIKNKHGDVLDAVGKLDESSCDIMLTRAENPRLQTEAVRITGFRSAIAKAKRTGVYIDLGDDGAVSTPNAF